MDVLVEQLQVAHFRAYFAMTPNLHGMLCILMFVYLGVCVCAHMCVGNQRNENVCFLL